MIDKLHIEDIRKGDLKAFEAFFNHYYARVRNFACGMVKDIDEAENIAQNVFMKIWINRRKLSTEKSMDSYVFTIVRNEILDSFRSASYSLNYKEFIREHSSEISDVDIEADYNIKEIKEIVDETVSRMPAQRKQVFMMSRKEYLTNDEIAERLGISKRTVEKHISLALQAIRNNLGEFLCFIFTFFIF